MVGDNPISRLRQALVLLSVSSSLDPVSSSENSGLFQNAFVGATTSRTVENDERGVAVGRVRSGASRGVETVFADATAVG